MPWTQAPHCLREASSIRVWRKVRWLAGTEHLKPPGRLSSGCLASGCAAILAINSKSQAYRLDFQRAAVALDLFNRRAHHRLHGNHFHALTVVIAFIFLPAWGTWRGADQILIGDVAGLVGCLPPAIDDCGTAIHRPGQVHQETDLSYKNQRVEKNARRLPQGRFVP